jgi:ubiquinone/menaquinone biosynthesis C-methylase UbiE
LNTKIENEVLTGKTVLEIGCGLGRTTRNLLSLLSAETDARLIVTDVSQKYLDRIRYGLNHPALMPQFIKTDACELDGIPMESIDYIVCNFAICEINSTIGQGTVALAKFLSVLKPGGKLFIEEELPITEANGPAQQSWANIWRVLKSALILTQQRMPSTEYKPETLSKICEIVGYTNVQWENSVRSHGLDWMQARLDFLESQQSGFPGPKVGAMFTFLAKNIYDQALVEGKVDVPIYMLSASKP